MNSTVFEMSEKKKLTEDQKARLKSDITLALKQHGEEEKKQAKLKLFSEKLIKENDELKAVNGTLMLRLTQVETELSDTKKELSDTKKELSEVKRELVKTSDLLAETIEEQKKQKEIMILLSEQFLKLKTNEPQPQTK